MPELKKIRTNLKDRSIADLKNLPALQDPRKIAMINLLMQLVAASFFTDRNLNALVVLHMVHLSLKYGNTEATPFSYANYGTFICNLGEYKTGHQFGQLALKLVRASGGAGLRAKIIHIFTGFINHWCEHAKTNNEIHREGFQAALEGGDLLFGGYIAFVISGNRDFQGSNLQESLEDSRKYLEFVRKIQFVDSELLITLANQRIRNLQGLTPDRFSLSDDSHDEEELLRKCKNSKMDLPLFYYYLVKLRIFYYHGKFEEALELAREADTISAEALPTLQYPEQRFYYALILFALWPDYSEADREAFKKIIFQIMKQMKRWADSCPENFLHKYHLLNAENARIEGRERDAMDLYDRAIASSRENEFIQNAALSCELAAKFYISIGKKRFARIFFQEAYYDYRKWGAGLKALDIEEAYLKKIFKTHTVDRRKPTETTSTSGSATAESLDLTSMLKASRAISGEIQLGPLLERLMKIVMENAGARKGIFLLEEGDRFYMQAQADLERGKVTVLQNIPLEQVRTISHAVIQYVVRTKESLVLSDVAEDDRFQGDEYCIINKSLSLLCAPIINQNRLIGLIYLENNLSAGAFTHERLDVLNLLCTQAAISIENARMYQNLEILNKSLELKVIERTKELEISRDRAEIAREEAEKSRLNIAKLADFSRRINETTNLEEVLDQIFSYVNRTFNIDGAMLFLIDQAKKQLYYFRDNGILQNFLSQEVITTIKNHRFILNNEGGIHWYPYSRKKLLYLPRLRKSQNDFDDYVISNLKLKSYLIVPLIIQGEVIGLIDFSNYDKRLKLQKSDIASISHFCEHIAGAIYTSSLLKQVQEEQIFAEQSRSEAEIAREAAEIERAKSDSLLLNILPEKVATELKEKGEVDPLLYDSVTILFTDLKGFTQVAESMSPDELVRELDFTFLQFDQICERHNIEKLKTIGDAYMAAGGVPELNYSHPVDMCRTAIEIQHFMNGIKEIKEEIRGEKFWGLRLGIHTGPVMAGVIGKNKFAYDVWGDSVNIASRMETSGISGRINISEDTYKLVKKFFQCKYRGNLRVKNHRRMKMYFLNRIRPELSKDDEGLVPNERFMEMYEKLL